MAGSRLGSGEEAALRSRCLPEAALGGRILSDTGLAVARELVGSVTLVDYGDEGQSKISLCSVGKRSARGWGSL